MINRFTNRLYTLIVRPKAITLQDIRKHLKKKDPVVVEAGAADGSDTVRFAKIFPKAQIYAFEPVSANYEILKKRVKKYLNVKTFKNALADYDGETEINISTDTTSQPDSASLSSSLLEPTGHLTQLCPQIRFNKKEIVTTTTLDSWAEKENINHIDVLWLDMQGMEYKVLKASPRILSTVQIICTEVSFRELYRDSILYDEFKTWLNSFGFEEVKKEFECEKGWGNALFVRKVFC
jgi:FkbM family methyltransferase